MDAEQPAELRQRQLSVVDVDGNFPVWPAAAFDAIRATLPLGSVGFERESDAKGEIQIWADRAVVERLSAA